MKNLFLPIIRLLPQRLRIWDSSTKRRVICNKQGPTSIKQPWSFVRHYLQLVPMWFVLNKVPNESAPNSNHENELLSIDSLFPQSITKVMQEWLLKSIERKVWLKFSITHQKESSHFNNNRRLITDKMPFKKSSGKRRPIKQAIRKMRGKNKASMHHRRKSNDVTV